MMGSNWVGSGMAGVNSLSKKCVIHPYRNFGLSPAYARPLSFCRSSQTSTRRRRCCRLR